MRRTLAVALVILGLASRAFASLAAVGPTHPVNGFPIWYTDGNGLKHDLCLDPEFCLFSPLTAAETRRELTHGSALWRQLSFDTPLLPRPR